MNKMITNSTHQRNLIKLAKDVSFAFFFSTFSGFSLILILRLLKMYTNLEKLPEQVLTMLRLCLNTKQLRLLSKESKWICAYKLSILSGLNKNKYQWLSNVYEGLLIPHSKRLRINLNNWEVFSNNSFIIIKDKFQKIVKNRNIYNLYKNSLITFNIHS